MNFNLQRTRNVRTPQFSHFSTGAKVPCWNKCEIVPVAAGDFFSSVMTGRSSILAGRDGWKIAALLLKCYGCGFMLMCVSAASLTSHIWPSEARSFAIKHLIYSTSASDLSRRTTCNKRQMHFARNWHKYFLQAFRSRYKIFFVIWKFILGEKGV